MPNANQQLEHKTKHSRSTSAKNQFSLVASFFLFSQMKLTDYGADWKIPILKFVKKKKKNVMLMIKICICWYVTFFSL